MGILKPVPLAGRHRQSCDQSWPMPGLRRVTDKVTDRKGAVVGPDILAVGLLTLALGVIVGGLVDLVLSKIDVSIQVVADPRRVAGAVGSTSSSACIVRER